MTKTTVIDEQGVAMAGPDEVAVAKAEAGGGGCVFVGASVGRVVASQAGILPMGEMPISDEMVRRAADKVGVAPTLARAILEAALRG